MPRYLIPRQSLSRRVQIPLKKKSIHHVYKQGTVKQHVPVAPYYDAVKA